MAVPGVQRLRLQTRTVAHVKGEGREGPNGDCTYKGILSRAELRGSLSVASDL